MQPIRAVLELEDEDLPKPSSVCKSFDRFEMWAWRRCGVPKVGHNAQVQ
jgi:hypothetical protein